ncbi:MAG: PH domain-containing protein [Candidatus Aenigmarchaeota archaeon]|nr:PH domain-containing protein [Candidatus Aenigmarchaeota archaeon]
MRRIHLKPTRLAFIKTYIVVIVLGVAVLITDMISGISTTWKLIFLLCLILLLADVEYRRGIVDYYLEEEQITEVEGFIAKRRKSIMYDKISEITISKGVLGRLFDFGNILLVGTAGMENQIMIKGIRRPQKILKIIEKKVHEKSS